jgi:hypothetical protein
VAVDPFSYSRTEIAAAAFFGPQQRLFCEAAIVYVRGGDKVFHWSGGDVQKLPE